MRTLSVSALLIGFLLLFGCTQQTEAERNASIQNQMQNQFPLVLERCGNLTEWALASCVADVAKEQNDWKQCMSLPIMNMWPGVCECITQFSIKSGNASLCEECSMPKEKGYCRAMVTGDWTECQRIVCDFSCSVEGEQRQKDLCISWIGLNKQDTSICNQIQDDEQLRLQCIGLVTFDESVCRQLTDTASRESCLNHAQYAPKNQNNS